MNKLKSKIMKSNFAFLMGLSIALFTTFNWSCKKDNPDTTPTGEDSFSDPRDGCVYKTITVDSLTWFAENLNFDTAGAVKNPEKSANGTGYGRLYTFGAAKTACPDGWHLSTDNEWKALLMHLGMNANDAGANGWNGTDQGKKLKSTTGWHNDGNGTDVIGFSALPAGWINADGELVGETEYALFWTSTLEQANAAYTRSLNFESDKIGHGGMTYKEDAAASVRCVKDESK
jgi:uncharacterized protein (TIGR02145 family)